MTIYINKPAKIDRIKLGGLGTEFKSFLVFKELAYEFKDIEPNVFNSKNIETNINNYSAAITYKANKKMVIRIEAGSTKSKFCYVTWEFVCKNIKGSNVHKFIERIECLMDYSPVFTYKIAFEIGKITYLELACDLRTPNIHSHLIFWKYKTQKGKIFNDGIIPKKGTIQIGCNNSLLHFSIYNKSKQLHETGEGTPLISYTRIEAILRKTKLTLSELNTIESPFIKLYIADAIDCRAKWQEPEWIKFLTTSLEETYPIALSELDKTIRKIYHARLKECSVKFWKPEFILDNISHEIAELYPENIYSA